jgi:hypothetical protein
MRREYGMQTVEQEQAEQIIQAVRVMARTIANVGRKLAPAFRQLGRMIADLDDDQKKELFNAYRR